MLQCIGKNEKIASDREYKHGQCVIPANVKYDDQIKHLLVVARHKTYNERFKIFGILGHASKVM